MLLYNQKGDDALNLREKVEFLMQRDGLKRSDVARITGMPDTTLDGITKRDTFENVKFSTLKSLCRCFDVDMRYLCYDEISDPDYGKQPLVPKDISESEHQLIDSFRSLNPDGQERLLDYADDLVQSGKYKKSDFTQMVDKNA